LGSGWSMTFRKDSSMSYQPMLFRPSNCTAPGRSC
jgi:hypothetical protein